MKKALASIRQELQDRRRALLAEMQRVDAALAALKPLDGPEAEQVQGGWTSLGIVGAARRLLEERGQPMSTRELADEMTRRGVPSQSKRLTATIYVVLRESAHFRFDQDIKKWRLTGTSPAASGPDEATPVQPPS